MISFITQGYRGIPIMDGDQRVNDDVDRALELVMPLDDTTHFGHRVVWSVVWSQNGDLWLALRLRLKVGLDLHLGMVGYA